MGTNSEPVDETGGCACGAVRFRVSGRPARVSICHCMTCRRIHGNVFGGYAMFERSAVEFTGPTQAWQSSRGRAGTFARHADRLRSWNTSTVTNWMCR
jgi:hypothetical protein